MSVEKFLDKRHTTRGGGTIRIELWGDKKRGLVAKYNLTYINHKLCTADNGRVLGFDNGHSHPGFLSKHHMHWFGRVVENKKFVSFEQTSERFQRYLKYLSHRHKEDY